VNIMAVTGDTFGGAAPHNIEAEQCVLGAILVNNEAFALVEPLISADDFFEPIHRDIYHVCAELIGAGKLATPITLRTYLPAGLDIDGLTLGQYIGRLAAEATTVINAPDYAKVVRNLADRRRLIATAEECITLLKVAPVDITPSEIAANTVERLDEITTGHVPLTLRTVSIGDAGRDALEQISRAMQGGANYKRGMKWGLEDINRRSDGIHRGELSICAGRPGMCKSGLDVHVALSAASDEYRVLYWSGEMTAEALVQRALTAIAYKISGRRIAYSDLRSARNMTDSDFTLLRDAYDQFYTLPIHIDPQPNLTVAQIAMRARRRKQKEGLDLLILDHLHRIRAADRYRGDATAEIGEISNACAALAKELDIGVLALCQLSRKTEEREDKRPMLSDLRQSGSLEQDADVVLFPYRDAYYLLQREPATGSVEHLAWENKLAACKDQLEINIAKQRQGATGVTSCFTAIECNAFYDAAPADRETYGKPGVAAGSAADLQRSEVA
jgi:replicative DNA helicase